MWQTQPDKTLLTAIGAAVRSERIAWKWRQEDLAARAGVGVTAVQRLESGEAIRTNTLLRVLRVLRMLDRLESAFAQAPAPSPLEMTEPEPPRERVRRPKGPGL